MAVARPGGHKGRDYSTERQEVVPRIAVLESVLCCFGYPSERAEQTAVKLR